MIKLGLVGRKIGMTRIFQDDGKSVPVTVLDVSGNRVTRVKTVETDGYNAIQVAFGTKKPSRVNKAAAGEFAKAGVEAAAVLKEFHIDADKVAEYKPGTVLGADIFTAGQKVDVTGTTIGKGFAGVIKRHHFSSNRASHGNSVTTVHRALSVTVRIRAVFSRVSVWPVSSATPSVRRRTWLWPASMLNAVCCSSAVPFPVPRAVKSSCVRRSRPN